MARPSLSLRIIPRFPAKILPGTAISITRTGGAVTVGMDWTAISSDPSAPAGSEVLVRETSGAFTRVAVSGMVSPFITWSNIGGKPSTFPPSAHNQDISTINGLQDALDSKTPLSIVPYFQYDTRAVAVASIIPPFVSSVRLNGYYAIGDSASALYRKISTPSPVKPWHFQSADGAYWELAIPQVSPRHLGAKGDNATDDTVALQAWSDYLSAFSAWGNLTAGIYLVPSASIAFDNDVIVEGVGDLSIIKRTTDVAAPLFLASGKDRVAFRNISLATTAGTTSTTSNTIGTGSKSFTIPAGLSFVNGDIVVAIQTSNSSNYMYGAVTSYSGTTLTINMTTTAGAGTFTDWTIGQNNGANVACRAINCTNVLMSRLKVTGLFYVGLEQQNCNGGRVIDNEISGVINRPIYVYAASGSADDIVVRDNLIMGNNFTMYGINLNGSTGGTITDVVVSGNQIEGTRFQGIDIAGGCVSVSVTGNNVSNLASGATGILIQRANSLVPYANTVSGNTIRDAGTGIYVLDAYYNTVSANSVSSCGTGIKLSQISATCQDNIVSGNNVSACTLFGITFDAATINLCGSSSCTSNVIVGVVAPKSPDISHGAAWAAMNSRGERYPSDLCG